MLAALLGLALFLNDGTPRLPTATVRLTERVLIPVDEPGTPTGYCSEWQFLGGWIGAGGGVVAAALSSDALGASDAITIVSGWGGALLGGLGGYAIGTVARDGSVVAKVALVVGAVAVLVLPVLHFGRCQDGAGGACE